MAEINDLNVTDASNTARWPEEMAPSGVNDAGRADEGILARWYKDTNGSLVTTGSSNAYALAINSTDTLYDGQVLVFDANHSNTGAATLNVTNSGGGAQGVVNILKRNDVALVSGDIEAGQKVAVVYDGTSFQMLSQVALGPDLVNDTTPQLGGDLDLNGNNIDFPTTANISDCLDEDDMATDSATVLATQQSIKAYVDATLATPGYTSAETAVAVNTDQTFTHSLGGVPPLYTVHLRCKTANLNHAVGEEVLVSHAIGNAASVGATVRASATIIGVATGSNITVIDPSTNLENNITVGSWKWVVRAWA